MAGAALRQRYGGKAERKYYRPPFCICVQLQLPGFTRISAKPMHSLSHLARGRLTVTFQLRLRDCAEHENSPVDSSHAY